MSTYFMCTTSKCFQRCELIIFIVNFVFGQIYHNGLISIGKRYYRSEPKRLTSLKKNVIAVFWANTDIVTSTTSITYQVVDRSTSEFREVMSCR